MRSGHSSLRLKGQYHGERPCSGPGQVRPGGRGEGAGRGKGSGGTGGGPGVRGDRCRARGTTHTQAEPHTRAEPHTHQQNHTHVQNHTHLGPEVVGGQDVLVLGPGRSPGVVELETLVAEVGPAVGTALGGFQSLGRFAEAAQDGHTAQTHRVSVPDGEGRQTGSHTDRQTDRQADRGAGR